MSRFEKRLGTVLGFQSDVVHFHRLSLSTTLYLLQLLRGVDGPAIVVHYHGGQAAEGLRGSLTGVFVGISTNDYGQLLTSGTNNLEPYWTTGNASCSQGISRSSNKRHSRLS